MRNTEAANMLLQFILAACCLCMAADANASARKILKYQIDHATLAGYMPGKRAEEHIIQIFPLASGGAAAVVQGAGSLKLPAAEASTASLPPTPAFISLFNTQGDLEQTGLLPVQVTRQDCHALCAELAIEVASIQGETSHHYIRITKSHGDAATHYDYILDTGTEGKLSWVMLGSQNSSQEQNSSTIRQSQGLYFNRREPLLYLETDRARMRTRVYALDLQ